MIKLKLLGYGLAMLAAVLGFLSIALAPIAGLVAYAGWFRYAPLGITSWRAAFAGMRSSLLHPRENDDLAFDLLCRLPGPAIGIGVAATIIAALASLLPSIWLTPFTLLLLMPLLRMVHRVTAGLIDARAAALGLDEEDRDMACGRIAFAVDPRAAA